MHQRGAADGVGGGVDPHLDALVRLGAAHAPHPEGYHVGVGLVDVEQRGHQVGLVAGLHVGQLGRGTAGVDVGGSGLALPNIGAATGNVGVSCAPAVGREGGAFEALAEEVVGVDGHGNAGGAAADHLGLRSVGSRAVGHNVEGVLGVGVEVFNGVGGAGDAAGDDAFSVRNGVGGAAVDIVGPGQRDAAGAGGADGQVGYVEAVGQLLDRYVVNTAVNGAVAVGTGAVVGAGELEGQTGAGGGVGSQGREA